MNKTLKIMLFMAAMFTLAAEAFTPLYALFVEKIGGDLFTAGQAYAVFGVFCGMLIFVISRWENRVKHKEKLIVAGYALKVIGFAALLLVARPLHFFLVQAVLGVGEAVAIPAYDSIYSRLLDQGKFASGWGMWEATWYITAAIAGLVGGFVAQQYGFDLLFGFMTIIAFIGFLASLGLLRAANKGGFLGWLSP